MRRKRRIATPRKALSKPQRQHQLERFGGHCGYCGCGISLATMQVDHMRPLIAGGANTESNFMPACRQCNNYKHFFTLEQFRADVADQLGILERNSRNYRTALRYRLLEPKPRAIVFYFETLGAKA